MLLETPVIIVHTLSSLLGYKFLEDINYIEYILMSLTVLGPLSKSLLREWIEDGWLEKWMDN